MEDDWCHVSDDEEFGFKAPSVRFTEIEPELEPEASTAAHPPRGNVAPADGDIGISLNDIDIAALLQDKFSVNSSETPPARQYSRDLSLSLLAPEHRNSRPHQVGGKCGEAHSYAPGGSNSSSSRKRNVKLAFCEPRVSSFPARLRVEMPSRRLPGGAVESPAFTPVTVLTHDQGTQASVDEVRGNGDDEDRSSRLLSALGRSMDVTNQLKAKSQESERMSLKLMNAEVLLDNSEHRHQRDLFKLRRLESGLVLAKDREKLSVEYQHQLKAEIEELRKENSELKRANDVLHGDSDLLASQPLDDLEKLETSLSKRLDSVRAVIRAKYKDALARKQEEDLCVVCFAEPISVVLLPCRHQVLCSTCALRVTTCPIDRMDIQDKVLTFGLSAYKD